MSAPFPKNVYVPKSQAKARETSFGVVIGLGFLASALIDFVKSNSNEKGYVNLDIVPRRTTDDFGNTHSVQLNQWKPDMNKMRQAVATSPPPAKGDGQPPSDDVPF